MGVFVDDYPDEAKVIRAALASSFLALFLGGLMGVIQALHRTDYFRFIDHSTYYTVLTLHGVSLAILFTIFFLVAFFTWAVIDSLDRGVENIWFTRGWYATMMLGSILAAVAILGGFVGETDISADVLFTFYAPLQAHPLFYLGLTLFIVGTWLAGADWIWSWWAWKQEHPGERTPLRAFMVLMTTLMWYLATVGVAIAVVFFLLPWSLGLVDSVNPLFTRTLFWYFGHPVVYFWLMPAYVLWYTILPKLSGGRLFSDPLARIVFVLFLILSVPTGIHHQYLDPGIAEGFKFLATVNTMFLLLPSLLTAFTVVASIEHGARQRGGEGYLGWLTALPWRSAPFTGMALAGLLFAAAGFSGMVNAALNLNYLVHNTLWIPGHFHLTVGTAVALSFMAATYWFLPKLTGREIYGESLTLLQVVLWFVGMVLMSNAMHRAGLAGVPRRTADPTYSFEYGGVMGTISELQMQIALGGILLFTSLLMFLGIVAASWFDVGDRPSVEAESLPPALSGPEHAPAVLENVKLWLGIAIAIVLLTYILPLAAIVSGSGLFGQIDQAVPAFLHSVAAAGGVPDWPAVATWLSTQAPSFGVIG